MKCPTSIKQLMHDYLDDDLSVNDEKVLRKHLEQCTNCQTYFHELNKSVALLKSVENLEAPIDFTQNVMAKLPKEKKVINIKLWISNRPFLTAVILFLLLMSGSFLSSWNGDKQFSVSKQSNLVVKNDTVIVPEGETVEGDVVVRNGKLKIEGKVNGDVTVINGEVIYGDHFLASTNHVSGEVKEVNEIFDWLWFRIKNTFKEIVSICEFSNEK